MNMCVYGMFTCLCLHVLNIIYGCYVSCCHAWLDSIPLCGTVPSVYVYRIASIDSTNQ